jgi:hypothetical protein
MNSIVKYGQVYKLNETEKELIIDMANRLEIQDRSYFKNNYKIDKSMMFRDMNINGFGAELAFCKLCNTKFDSSTNKKENHFNNFDTILNTGLSVDVKQTKYKSGKLLVRIGKEEKKVDIYSLMIGEFPSYTFMGFAYYNDIISNNNIITINNKKTYALNQYQLIKELNIE